MVNSSSSGKWRWGPETGDPIEVSPVTVGTYEERDPEEVARQGRVLDMMINKHRRQWESDIPREAHMPFSSGVTHIDEDESNKLTPENKAAFDTLKYMCTDFQSSYQSSLDYICAFSVVPSSVRDFLEDYSYDVKDILNMSSHPGKGRLMQLRVLHNEQYVDNMLQALRAVATKRKQRDTVTQAKLFCEGMARSWKRAVE